MVTPFHDLSLVYGNSDEELSNLRSHNNGKLRVAIRKGQEWPPRDPYANVTCALKKRGDACYLVGDPRIDQNTDLSVFQILLLREHNRLANELQRINMHWDDETVFQEARRIHIAQVQKITFSDWLPLTLGKVKTS